MSGGVDSASYGPFFCGFLIGLMCACAGCLVLADQPPTIKAKARAIVTAEARAEASEHGCGSYVLVDPATGKTEWRWNDEVQP